MRGPLLYCVEQADNPGIDLHNTVIAGDGAIEAEFRPDLLGGVVALRLEALATPPGEAWRASLYRTAAPGPNAVRGQPTTITAIPYHAWANREPGPMRVWLRRG